MGVGVGVGVGVEVGVGVGVGIGVGVGVGIGAGIGVNVCRGLAVGSGLDVGDGTGEAPATRVGSSVGTVPCVGAAVRVDKGTRVVAVGVGSEGEVSRLGVQAHMTAMTSRIADPVHKTLPTSPVRQYRIVASSHRRRIRCVRFHSIPPHHS